MKLGSLLSIAVACGATAASATAVEPFAPVPQTLNVDPARAALGRRLFSDVRLSRNNSMSCASCHPVARAGADGEARSRGLGGRLTETNAPTVLNAALNFRQFWDGRAVSLEEQVEKVVANPVSMGSQWPDVVRKIAADKQYRRDFAAAFDDGVSQKNIQVAIADYERTLITPNSRFDRFLRGEQRALNAQELDGLQRFKLYGCAACHQGVNIGGNLYQKLGIMANYPSATPADQGRYRLTGQAADRQVFKVPGLRNVGRTAPYLHDASAKTLEEAIEAMFRYQLGRQANKEDTAAIAAFLRTLDAEPSGQP